MNFSLDKFSARLKDRREELGLTQADLAAKVGVSSQTISAYERNSNTKSGGKMPSLDKAFEIAGALDVSLDWLCGKDASTPSEINNVADLLEYLRHITGYVHCLAGASTLELQEEDVYFETNDLGEEVAVTTVKIAQLKICNWALANFLESRNKVYKLCMDGVLSKDVYDSWYVGELEKLKKWPLQRTPGAIGEFESIE